MNKSVVRAIVAAMVLTAGFYFWNGRQRATAAAVIFPNNHATEQSEESYEEAREANEMVTVSGPLANYMLHGKTVPIETLKAISYKSSDADRENGSPVGSTRPLLHKTFAVSGLTDVSFEVPAHSATPQLRGSFQSYPEASDKPTGDGNPDVDFLVLNVRQYADFLHGHPDEAIFSADQTHDQDVNASLPPTMQRPVTYHLVFRGDGTTRKVVKADFRIEF